MPKYKSNAYLVQNGFTVRPDENIMLTEEQAKRLGDKVTLIEEPKEEVQEVQEEPKEPEVEVEEKPAPRKRSTKKDK